MSSSPQRVRLRQLTLNSYRNYPHFRLDLEAAHLVLSGKNGVGKTNILEAISLLSPGRGLRRAAYSEIIHVSPEASAGLLSENLARQVQQDFVVHARLNNPLYGDIGIGTASVRTPSGEIGRRMQINAAAQPIDHILEYCRVIWLTPSQDGLFSGSAGERRRFLDRLVLSIEPSHGRSVRDYEKAMRARNKLLTGEKHNIHWLASIERQMAALGVAIASARWQLVDQLGALVVQGHHDAFPSALMMLDGMLERQLSQGQPALDVEEAFCAALAKSRPQDRLSGRTTIGPHRSDLKIIHREKNIAAALASTGEQKALLTGIILSHTRLTSLLSGFTPLLLLDEITAHLDQLRVGALFELIDDMGVQAFLTGTERSLFAHLEGRGQFVTLTENL